MLVVRIGQAVIQMEVVPVIQQPGYHRGNGQDCGGAGQPGMGGAGCFPWWRLGRTVLLAGFSRCGQRGQAGKQNGAETQVLVSLPARQHRRLEFFGGGGRSDFRLGRRA